MPYSFTRVQTRVLQFIRNRSFILFTAGLVCVVFLFKSSKIEHLGSISTNRFSLFDVSLFASLDDERNRILAEDLNLLADDDPALLSTQIHGSDCTLGMKPCYSLFVCCIVDFIVSCRDRCDEQPTIATKPSVCHRHHQAKLSVSTGGS